MLRSSQKCLLKFNLSDDKATLNGLYRLGCVPTKEGACIHRFTNRSIVHFSNHAVGQSSVTVKPLSPGVFDDRLSFEQPVSLGPFGLCARSAEERGG